jgi:hypothetical protein
MAFFIYRTWTGRRLSSPSRCFRASPCIVNWIYTKRQFLMAGRPSRLS